LEKYRHHIAMRRCFRNKFAVLAFILRWTEPVHFSGSSSGLAVGFDPGGLSHSRKIPTHPDAQCGAKPGSPSASAPSFGSGCATCQQDDQRRSFPRRRISTQRRKTAGSKPSSLNPLDKEHWLKIAEEWLKLAQDLDRQRRRMSLTGHAAVSPPREVGVYGQMQSRFRDGGSHAAANT
jgi:hypothetical protein